MKQHDLAVRSLVKASQDEFVADRLLSDADVADEVIGFHLQQATEKLLKAVLAEQGVDIRKTHNLTYLIDQVEAIMLPYNTNPV